MKLPTEVKAELLAQGLKYCYKCEQVKSVEGFYSSTQKRDGLMSSCKDCVNANNRRGYLKQTPEQRRGYKLRTKFNLTEAQIADYAANPVGHCAICGKTSLLCVDHDHETQKVRGRVCNPCNSALGLAQDSVTILQAMIDYLNKHGTVDIYA
jgi:hypothetical protein